MSCYVTSANVKLQKRRHYYYLLLRQPKLSYKSDGIIIICFTVNCCMRRTCWSFTTRGLCTVGQDEAVVLLECLQDETVPPPDVFHHIAMLYEQASQGSFQTQCFLSSVSFSEIDAERIFSFCFQCE